MHSEGVNRQSSITQSGNSSLSAGEIKHRIRLTPREAEILHYVTLGESNKQIARRLGISNYTVRDHVSNLLKKAEVTSRSRLALVLPTTPLQPAVPIP